MLFQSASFLALLAAVYAQSSTINTPPSVVQCQPVQVSWTSINTPVFISIIPGGQAGAAALQDFGQQTGTSLTWNANIAAGTSITFQLRDSTGAVAFSSPVSVQGSSDSSCLGQSASVTSGTAAPTSAASSSTEPTSSAPATTSAVSSSVASASSSVSSVLSSVSASVSSAISSATAPATTSRSATVVPSSSGTGTATGAAPTNTSNGALPAAKAGLVGLLGVAAAVVMA
ncbi:hypothetical protein BN14_03651 [Rhizoctonia solani AG-1 IB]|uniref:Ser-Thr-rich glycosyl-phosphatidyl-inositol-anchored membrane family-domain-containing protein n=1 Tax=Thanatephorus cucumeris (strain AG1-IB / isolate 7/3/14) TaxID=1108050 RepID=M5BPI8_THACB|nr:hypothetical protein BN14_03651 [Rhizoctonia solani AG-1 IB]